MRSTSILGLCLCLAACAEPPALQSHFDPAEVVWFAARGTNTVHGTAIVRNYNGRIKTCSAQAVLLIPVSVYARERMNHLYGSDTEGFNPVTGGIPADFGGDDPRYMAAAKTTHCDRSGHFAFTELPDGDYFVVATVTWRERAAGIDEGGYLMRRIHVSTGETKEVLLAQ